MKYEYIIISDSFLDTDIYQIKKIILERKIIRLQSNL